MNILQIGMGKSGNLWLYQIIQNILRESGQTFKNFIQTQPIYEVAKTWGLSFKDQAGVDCITIEPNGVYYRISSIFRMPIERMSVYAEACSHVWLQSMPCIKTEETLSHFNKIIYIIRDPRDAAISNSKYTFTPYRQKYAPHTFKTPEMALEHQLPHDMIQWVKHVGGYLLLKEKLNIHLICYENLLHSFEKEFERLLQYLHLSLSIEQRLKIADSVNFENMKNRDPNHVRKGQFSQWKNTFTDSQIKTSQNIAGKMFEKLGYTQDIPDFPEKISIEEIQTIIRAAEKKYLLKRVFQKAKKSILRCSPFYVRSPNIMDNR